MPSGVRLGAAYFELEASAAPLIAALKASEEASRASVQKISAATGIAERDVQRLAQTYIRSEKQRSDASAAATLRIITAHNNAADSAEKAAARHVAASQKAASSFGDLTKSALGFTAAAAGVTVGAVAVNQALSKVAEQTQKTAQAQFQLNAAYGSLSPQMTKLSLDLAAATGKSNAALLEGVGRFGVLMKGYGLSEEQIKKLTTATLDLAAATGTDTVEAFERMIGVFRDGGESAEKLSLVLNDQSIKGFASLTAEQRKNFDQMDAITKSQIRYTEAINQAASAQGKAIERANSQLGAWDKLTASSDNLAAAFGKEVTSGSGGGLVGGIANVISGLGNLIERSNEAQQAISELKREGASGFTGGLIDALLHPDAIRERVERNRSNPPPAPFPTLPDGLVGPVLPTAGRAAIIAARDANEKAVKSQLDAADKANDAAAESAIKAIDRERKEKERWYDEERSRIEARRTYQLEDIDARHKAAIKALADERQAQKDADDAAIKDAERRKDAELDAVNESARRANDAIEQRGKEYARARELEDRATATERQRQDRELADFRQRNDREREQAHKADLKRIDDRHTRAVRGFEREADAARKATDDDLRGIDRRAKAEDERHRKRLEQIDRESQRQLDAIDAQLRALDDADRTEQNADRTGDLQKKVSEAQAAVTAARPAGTAEEIAAARNDLSAALRGGAELTIANARERLSRLAGAGAAAIKKAEEDLAAAEKALRDEGVKETRDAERQKLKDAQARIRDQTDAEKKAEDERNRRRKDALDKDKQAAQDGLKDALDKIDKRKQREADDTDARVRRVTREYEEQKQRLDDARRDQDRALDDRRKVEDQDRADRRRAEDEALEAQKKAVARNQEEQRTATEAHYNGPNGIITQLKAASEQHEREYSRQVAATNVAFEAERKSAERFFTNPEGNGLLDLLAKARIDEMAKLEQSKLDWAEWQKAASEKIKAATADLDEFIKRAEKASALSGRRPDGGVQQESGQYGPNAPPGYGSRSEEQQALVKEAHKAARDAGIDEDFFEAQINQESGFNPNATSSAGAQGIAQFMPDTARRLGLPNPYNPHDALIVAAEYMAHLLRKYHKDLARALVAYSAGEGFADGWDGQSGSLPGETREYLRAIGVRGYAAGGWIDRPSYLVDARSGQWWGSIAEREPEYVSPRSRMSGSSSMLGSGPPLPNYAAVGAAMGAAHPGGTGGGTSYGGDTLNFHGVAPERLFEEWDRRQHRRQLMRGQVRRG